MVTAVIWLGLLVCVLVGAKQFTLWSQVEDLHAAGATLGSLFAESHPHALRYLLVTPIYAVVDLTGMPKNYLFSIVCIALLFITVELVIRTESAVAPGHRSWTRPAVTAFLVVVSLFMNGRVVFGLFGYASLLYIFVAATRDRRIPWEALIAVPAATLFCSVSSGIVVVAFAFSVIAAGWALLRSGEVPQGPRIAIVLVVSVLVSAAIFGHFLLVGIEKNLAFFGGGLEGAWKMLSHGVGIVFTKADPYLLAMTVPMLLMAAGLTLWAARILPWPVVLAGSAVMCAGLGGMFGFSTLSVGMIPLLTLVRYCVTIPVSDSSRHYAR